MILDIHKNIEGHERVLTPAAVDFLHELNTRFKSRRDALLQARTDRQEAFDEGALPAFPDVTQEIREGDWKVAPIPTDLRDRRVEITGPVDRKMIINALNSGANVFMADFEDSNSPTFENLIDGQINLMDAVRKEITFEHPTKGTYTLVDEPATLMVRPRGLHLDEAHVTSDGQPISASLFDFGLYFFHNAQALLDRESGPYFYLPKLESRHEAQWWNDVFVFAQSALEIPQGTIRATVLIETITAAFEMDEILHALRRHSAGLNCGRWDYIFSYIKKFRKDPNRVLPDRGQVGMDQPFMNAYATKVIQTCHNRGVHAMGGMAAQIPIKSDPELNEKALEKVRADKMREVKAGHDGTWVAHPGLVPIAKEIFDAHMPEHHQINGTFDTTEITEKMLVEAPTGTRTLDGLRLNIRVGIQYLAAWIDGNGCVPLYNLMEDAATAEISRTQIWQWLHHGVEIEGQKLTPELFRAELESEIANLRGEIGDVVDQPHFVQAVQLFDQLCTQEDFEEFLTLPAYELLINQ